MIWLNRHVKSAKERAAEMVSPALGNIGSEELLAGAALVKRGEVYDLGTPLGGGVARGPSSTFANYRLSQYKIPRCLLDPDHDSHDFNMDVIEGSPHLGSHIDGLVHIQSSGRIFGGDRVNEVFDDTGWKMYGIETVPPIVARGVLIDVAGWLGTEQIEDGREITSQQLQDALAHQKTDLRRGDVVLVRTGKIREYLQGSPQYFVAQPGVNVEAALWLYDQGMSVLGTDTSGTEPQPFKDPKNTVHRAMLVERGVHLLEILDLDEIASWGIYEFLFVCTPLRFQGATGSWVRPIAIA